MRILLAILLMLAPVPALSQSPGTAPIVQTTLKPSEGIVIGQPVTVNVAVLFPDEMQHPPLVRIPEAAGAQIMRFESQGITIRDTVDGRDYVGQTFEFVLFPRRGGTIEVPAPQITLLNRAGDPTGSAQGPAARIEVTVPPGIDPSGPVLVADRVSVEQSWSPNPTSARLKAGDAIVRTIQRRADGVPALGMAEFHFSAPDGVRIYVDPPVVEDQRTRFGVDGHRTDKVTYVFEKAGSFDLPALSQPWLSLPGKEAREETLPGMKVTVASPAGIERTSHGSTAWITGILCFIGVGVLTLVAWFGRRRWQAVRERYRSSPSFSQRELERVAKTGDAVATYRAVTQWKARLSADNLIVLERDFAAGPLLAKLRRAIFSSNSGWDADVGEDLARAIAHWSPLTAPRPRAEALPPLNPAVFPRTSIQRQLRMARHG